MRNLQARRAQLGFTLLEIMVVVVILGILSALVVPQVLENVDQAKKERVKSDIAAIEGALNLYKLDNYTYPSTEQGLDALVTRPSGQPEPKNYKASGYLKLQLDPWQGTYQYVYPGEHNPDSFDIYSLGADGQIGGEGMAADIGNWTDETQR